MKIPMRYTLLITALVSGTAALVSCSKEPEFKTDVNVSAMIQQLKGTDKDQKASACSALADAGPGAAEAVPALTEALKDDDPLVKRLAAYALGKIGPKAASAVPALKELLSNSDVSVVQNALIALRSIDPKAVPGVKLDNVQTETAPK